MLRLLGTCVRQTSRGHTIPYLRTGLLQGLSRWASLCGPRYVASRSGRQNNTEAICELSEADDEKLGVLPKPRILKFRGLQPNMQEFNNSIPHRADLVQLYTEAAKRFDEADDETFQNLVELFSSEQHFDLVEKVADYMSKNHILPLPATAVTIIEAHMHYGVRDAGYQLLADLEGNLDPSKIPASAYTVVMRARQKPYFVLDLYDRMCQRGIPLDLDGVQMVTYALQKLDRHAEAKELVRSYEGVPGLPVPKLHQQLLRSCTTSNEAFQVLRDIENSGHSLSYMLFHTLIDHCINLRDPDAAEQAIDLMMEKGFAQTVTAQRMRVQICGLRGDVRGALKTASHLSLPNTDAFNKVLDCVQTEEDAQLVLEELLPRMKSSGVGPTSETLVKLMKMCVSHGRHQAGLKLFRSLPVQLDRSAYHLALNIMLELNDVDGLEELMNEMKSRGIRTTDLPYNNLMAYHARQSDVKSVFEVLARMREAGVRPTVVTYSIMVDCCAMAGELELAFKVVDTMRSEGIRGNSVTYTLLHLAAMKLGSFNDSVEVLRLMHKDNVSSSFTINNGVLQRVASSGDAEATLKLFADLRNEGSIDARSYEIVIASLAKSGDSRRALALLSEGIDDRLLEGIDVRIFSSALATCVRNVDVASAEQIFAMMKQRGVRPDQRLYGTFQELLLEAGDVAGAFQVFHDMRKEGLKPDGSNYSKVFRFLSSTGDVAAMHELLKMLIEQGSAMDKHSFIHYTKFAMENLPCPHEARLLRNHAHAMGLDADEGVTAAAVRYLNYTMSNRTTKASYHMATAHSKAPPDSKAMKALHHKYPLDKALLRYCTQKCFFSLNSEMERRFTSMRTKQSSSTVNVPELKVEEKKQFGAILSQRPARRMGAAWDSPLQPRPWHVRHGFKTEHPVKR